MVERIGSEGNDGVVSGGSGEEVCVESAGVEGEEEEEVTVKELAVKNTSGGGGEVRVVHEEDLGKNKGKTDGRKEGVSE